MSDVVINVPARDREATARKLLAAAGGHPELVRTSDGGAAFVVPEDIAKASGLVSSRRSDEQRASDEQVGGRVLQELTATVALTDPAVPNGDSNGAPASKQQPFAPVADAAGDPSGVIARRVGGNDYGFTGKGEAGPRPVKGDGAVNPDTHRTDREGTPNRPDPDEVHSAAQGDDGPAAGPQDGEAGGRTPAKRGPAKRAAAPKA